MKFVALISGGKDSWFAAIEAIRGGHELAAMANLYVDDAPDDERDSMMFQTVGHTMVPRMAECLRQRVPLYRRALRGAARQKALAYTRAVEGDEVEDLAALLRDVLRAQPDVGAVCSGAILSTYQRLRVEHVCRRLRLVSLAPLWRRTPQAALLDDMTAARMRVVLVKVACVGLRVADVGASLLAPPLRARLCRLAARYAVNEAGEGGEYETSVIDCPLFAHALRLERFECVTVVDDDAAPTAHMARVVVAVDAEPKTAAADELDRQVMTPTSAAGAVVVAPYISDDAAATTLPPATADAIAVERSSDDSTWLCVRRVPSAGDFERALRLLQRATDGGRIVYLMVYLANDMSAYAALNGACERALGWRHPPARAVVAVATAAADAGVATLHARCVRGGDDDDNDDDEAVTTLHVQSVSAWAPASIGPYAQASVVGARVVLLAGQIALAPATMQLVGAGDAAAETRRALCNAAAVLDALGGRALAANARRVVLFHVAAAARSTVDACVQLVRDAAHVDAVVCARAVAALPRNARIELVVFENDELPLFRYPSVLS